LLKLISTIIIGINHGYSIIGILSYRQHSLVVIIYPAKSSVLLDGK